jgi:alanine dehydrogenase
MNIGLVKETKIKENRVALIPEHVKQLVNAGHKVFVENNAGLVAGFPNEKYEKGGAKIVNADEVYQQQLIVRVKEPPIESLRENQILIGYLHIEKNQNPTLLKALLEKNITSYASEEIRDPVTKHRLVSLGFEAGIVGMFEGLRSYGKLLEKQNFVNPFQNIKPIWDYQNKVEAYLALRDINPRDFKAKVCVAGYGKVSKGCQEVLAQLSHPPLVLREEDTVRTKILGKDFTYIWKYLSEIDLFVNAIVWQPGQSRIIDNQDLELMKNHSLIVDISCDAAGGVQSCQPTTWDNPTYIVKTSKDKEITHFCVDNLPSAMAYDSSVCLSRMLWPFVLKVADGKELEGGLMTKEGKFVYKPIA